jgi:hypothetical protein
MSCHLWFRVLYNLSNLTLKHVVICVLYDWKPSHRISHFSQFFSSVKDPKNLCVPLFSVGFKLMTSRFEQELGTCHPQVKNLVPTTNISWRKQELTRPPTWLEGSRNLLPTTILFLAISGSCIMFLSCFVEH